MDMFLARCCDFLRFERIINICSTDSCIQENGHLLAWSANSSDESLRVALFEGTRCNRPLGEVRSPPIAKPHDRRRVSSVSFSPRLHRTPMSDEQENPFARRRGSRDNVKGTQTAPVPPLRYASDIPSAERHISAAEPASNDTEAWMNHLQWLHLLEGRLRGDGLSGGGDASRQLVRWADWLVPSSRPTSGSVTSAGATEVKEGDEERGSDVRGDLQLVQADGVGASDGSIGASIAGDTTCGVGVYVDIPDHVDLPVTSAAADTRETAETAMNSPRSAESLSSSSTPSWVMANGSSTDSSSASSAPSSFEVTPLLDEDNRSTATPSTATITAPTSLASPLPFEAATSVESASFVNSGDGDRASGPRNAERYGDEASSASHRVLAAIMRELDLAEEAVAEARQTLLDKGFSQPSHGHVLQVLLRNATEDNRGWDRAEDSGETNNSGRSRVRGRGSTVPTPSVFLASVALSLYSETTSLGESNASLADSATTAAVADASSQRGSGDDADEGESWFGAVDGDNEAVGSWGFRDSGFCLESDRADGGDPYVVMRGNRSVLDFGEVCMFFRNICRSLSTLSSCMRISASQQRP